jgi:tetrapyrrole methylase family protein/MazG family protein/ATP diphosphatase
MKPVSTPIDQLLEIMRRLRDPVAGCPWDREQTFASIAPYTLEEAYEVADAIARGDLVELKDELGDLLLQVVYHARMAEEAGAFDFAGVVETINAKMVRRHPHVFGGARVDSAAAQTQAWESLKAEERTNGGGARARSVLDDVPVALPALARARKLGKRVARVGFDWPDAEGALDKVEEEFDELRREAGSEAPRERLFEEFGDLLFALCNVARKLDLDPEAALRHANAKFERRFRAVETRLAARGRTPADSDLAEMDALWNEVKAAEH